MESITTDLFATKGVEYLLVISYLVLLVTCWKLIFPRKRREQPSPESVNDGAPERRRRSFHVPDGLYYHQGHAWAQVEPDGHVRIGIDDFAQQLLGLSNGVLLPDLGRQLTLGEPGWQIQLADGVAMPMLAPVDGEVVGVNPEVLLHPALVNSDPYGRGWLLEVRARDVATVRRNLMCGPLAEAWTRQLVATLPSTPGAELGIVLPGGTYGATGIARAVSPQNWQAVARSYLMLDETPVEAAVLDETRTLTV